MNHTETGKVRGGAGRAPVRTWIMSGGAGPHSATLFIPQFITETGFPDPAPHSETEC